MDEEDVDCSCCRKGWHQAIRGRRIGASNIILGDRAESRRDAGGPEGSAAKPGVSAEALNEGGLDSLDISEQPISQTDAARSSVMRTLFDCAREGMFRHSRVSDARDVRKESRQCTCTVSSDSPSSCKLVGDRWTCDPMQDRLSGGHLEAGCPVPTLHWRSNSTAQMYRNHFVDSDDSVGSQSPRRSAGSGSFWRWLHCLSSACVCAHAIDQQCICADIGERSWCETIRHAGGSALVSAQARLRF